MLQNAAAVKSVPNETVFKNLSTALNQIQKDWVVPDFALKINKALSVSPFPAQELTQWLDGVLKNPDLGEGMGAVILREIFRKCPESALAPIINTLTACLSRTRSLRRAESIVEALSDIPKEKVALLGDAVEPALSILVEGMRRGTCKFSHAYDLQRGLSSATRCPIRDARLLDAMFLAFHEDHDQGGMLTGLLRAAAPERLEREITEELKKRIAGSSPGSRKSTESLLGTLQDCASHETLLQLVEDYQNLQKIAPASLVNRLVGKVVSERPDIRVVPVLEEMLSNPQADTELKIAAIGLLSSFTDQGAYDPPAEVLDCAILFASDSTLPGDQCLEVKAILGHFMLVDHALKYVDKHAGPELKVLALSLAYLKGSRKNADVLSAVLGENNENLDALWRKPLLSAATKKKDPALVAYAASLLKDDALSTDRLAVFTYLDAVGCPAPIASKRAFFEKLLEARQEDKTKGASSDEFDDVPSLIEAAKSLLPPLAASRKPEVLQFLNDLLKEAPQDVQFISACALLRHGYAGPAIRQAVNKGPKTDSLLAEFLPEVVKVGDATNLGRVLSLADVSADDRFSLDMALSNPSLRREFFRRLEEKKVESAHNFVEPYEAMLKLGIAHPLRFEVGMLETIVKNRAAVHAPDPRPRAVIVLPYEDRIGAFYYMADGLKDLFEKYNVLVYECRSDRGFEGALREAARWDPRTRTFLSPIDFLDIGGHGSPHALAFGAADPAKFDVKDTRGPAYLDRHDAGRLSRVLRGSVNGTIFLNSCSNGYGEDFPGMQDNMAHATREIFGPGPRKVISGVTPIGAESIVYRFGRDGRIEDVDFDVKKFIR